MRLVIILLAALPAVVPGAHAGPSTRWENIGPNGAGQRRRPQGDDCLETVNAQSLTAQVTVPRSLDGGRSWTVFGGPDVQRGVEALLVSSDGRKLYAGTVSGSVHRRSLG